MNLWKNEVADGHRFNFGRNWAEFITNVDVNRIRLAETSLQRLYGTEAFKGKTFLDAGCGSGLFSLAAMNLGMKVVSVDFDPDCVNCTLKLKEKFYKANFDWIVVEGSVLDLDFIKSLGKFDFVYSWGVLHHTGSMWQSIGNLTSSVDRGGMFGLAIYNDQGLISVCWKMIKTIWNKIPFSRVFLIFLYWPYFILLRRTMRFLRGAGSLERGMSLKNDMIDWLGGFPFEVAKPKEVTVFLTQRGFRLINLTTVGKRQGCNEFLFIKN